METTTRLKLIPLVLIAMLFFAAGAYFALRPTLAEAAEQAEGSPPVWDAEAPWESAEKLMEALPAIPFSKHACVSHADEKYNAHTISSMLLGIGFCQDKYVYVCPAKKKIYVFCDVHTDFTAGLIVGYEGDSCIVTGYPKAKDRWKMSGCQGPFYVH